MKNRVIIGTRTSKLALYQAFKVEKELKKNFPDLEVEIKKIKTKGDILLDKPLDRSLDKGYFVKEIQELLIQNKIDIAVHSLKDLPVEKIDELEINAVLERANPQDVFLSRKNKKLSDFSNNELIGTTSLRRKAQLLKINPKLQINDIRGNVDTRIKKMENGDYDAIILSKAGIDSLEIKNKITEEFKTDDLIPCAGQGIIAIQCRNSDIEIKKLLEKINDNHSRIRANTEREVLKTLEGDCDTAVGAFSNIDGNNISLSAELFSVDGKHRYFVKDTKDINLAKELGKEVGETLKSQSKGSYKR